ncbi:hypothetical protein Ahia01_000353300 [Argonauta hians]
MTSRIYYLLWLVTAVVSSENITSNDNIENILLDYNSNSTNNTSSRWFFKQMLNILNCGPLPKLSNSKVTYTLKWNEQRISVEQRCDRYFEASQKINTNITCHNGKWLYEDKKCKLITCPTFYKPAHSRIIGDSNTYNSVIYFICFRGYFLRGNYSMRCEENKLWSSPPPVCENVKCIPYQAKHSIMSTTNEVGVNETIRYSCQEPYVLKGESTLTCLDDGEWNFPIPVCTLACIVPKIEGRVMNNERKILKPNSIMRSGDKVYYSCQQPFIPITLGVTRCLQSKWYPDIQCKKGCNIENTTGVNFTFSPNMSVINYYCPFGKVLLGDSKRICLKDGTWSGKLPVCVKNCIVKPDRNIYSFRNVNNLQYVPFRSSVLENTSLIYMCQAGLVPQTLNVTCRAGKITPTPRCLFKNISVVNRELVLKQNTSSKIQRICKLDEQTCEYFGHRTYRESCNNCRSYECIYIDYSPSGIKIKKAPSCCVLRCY